MLTYCTIKSTQPPTLGQEMSGNL